MKVKTKESKLRDMGVWLVNLVLFSELQANKKIISLKISTLPA